jgi:hypothetical protein
MVHLSNGVFVLFQHYSAERGSIKFQTSCLWIASAKPRRIIYGTNQLWILYGANRRIRLSLRSSNIKFFACGFLRIVDDLDENEVLLSL